MALSIFSVAKSLKNVANKSTAKVRFSTSNSRTKITEIQNTLKSWKHDGFGFHIDFTRKITKIQNSKKIREILNLIVIHVKTYCK